MNTAGKQKRTPVEKSTDQFLRVLRERNASAHTIKAYAVDLENFANYVGTRDWKKIDHIAIRGFLSHLYEKGLSKASVARSLAAVRSMYRWLLRPAGRGPASARISRPSSFWYL